MRPRRAAPLLTIVLLLAGFAAIAQPAQAQEPTVKLMVLGETHGTRSVTRGLVEIASAKGATGCVCPGDFIYGHWDTSPGAWRDMMRPVMGGLMPAQGNHDWPWSDWSGLFPGGAHYYAKDVNGVHFIALNTEYSLAPGSKQRAWLDATLAERDPGALKVVFMHRPWWLPDGARHPASEFATKNGVSGSAMDALMRQHGVDLVVSAHEKNYQHSLRDGVHYLVAGGGTHDFYGMGYSLPGAIKRLQQNVVTTMDVTSSRLTLKSYDISWSKVEEWTIDASAAPQPAPAPQPSGADVSFTHRGGNEWWVQAAIGGADAWRVRSVESRDTGGAWIPLTKRWWGDWANSYRIEPGHLVHFRATLDDGRTVESCAFTHPGGAPQCSSAPAAAQPSPASYDATFRNARGNAWWLEVEVQASGLQGVDARVNGGSWVTLGATSWGSWAKSVHAPAGSQVEFRARGPDGASALSQAYAWPLG